MAGSTTKVDRDALHRLLWSETDHRGVIRLHQGELAAQLNVTKFTMSRIVHELLDEGRLEKIGSSKRNVASYIVTDPETWHGPATARS